MEYITNENEKSGLRKRIKTFLFHTLSLREQIISNKYQTNSLKKLISG